MGPRIGDGEWVWAVMIPKIMKNHKKYIPDVFSTYYNYLSAKNDRFRDFEEFSQKIPLLFNIHYHSKKFSLCNHNESIIFASIR